MTALVIHAHPVPDSLNRALYGAAIAGLTTTSAPATASLCEGDDPDAAALDGVTTLVFVHPTWWGGPPAVLFDWIQRRLGPWIDGTPREPSPLATVTHLATVTTHGSPKLLNRITGEPGRRLYERAIRPICAPECEWAWMAYYGIDADDTTTRAAFLASIPERLRDFTRS